MNYQLVYQEWDLLREARTSEAARIVEGSVAPATTALPFAAKMQEARIRLRYTVDEVARRCHTTSEVISTIESGVEMPLPALYSKLVQELALSE